MINNPTSYDGIFFIIIAYSCTMVASWKMTLRYIQFFQQEEYDNFRFIRWWFQSVSLEKRATSLTILFLCISFLNSYISLINDKVALVGVSIQSIGFLVSYLVILYAGFSNQFKATKKNLVLTSRVKRILVITYIYMTFVSVLLYLLFGSIAFIAQKFYLLTVCVFILIPICIVLANLTLSPIESITQKKYLQEAKERLRQVKPEIVAITGSYGKTSFKHILNHILASHSPTLVTPGSVNTLMGITRIVRERLRNDHVHFIVEMGAYGIGSIKRLCGLTPPKVGIVTAVGLAHYERFKSIETVKTAKSELPESVPEDGLVILNGDDANVRSMSETTQAKTFFYGRNDTVDCQLIHEEMTENGTKFTLRYNEKDYTMEMPIYGSHQALNATGAFLTSVKLGVAPITAIAALKTLPPINHRLVVEKDSNGLTTIDDAYNSNPTGFQCALEVLKKLPGSRRILVTPGMVELGESSEKEHRQIARQAVDICEYIIIIASQRIPFFRDEIKKQNYPENQVFEFETLDQAREWLKSKLQQGDVVLIENDLPDLYEAKSAFRFF
jgi:UDP-N-acetylmuramoyl-tripeptide--D-alanyl-D-alanine ligase